MSSSQLVLDVSPIYRKADLRLLFTEQPEYRVTKCAVPNLPAPAICKFDADLSCSGRGGWLIKYLIRIKRNMPLH